MTRHIDPRDVADALDDARRVVQRLERILADSPVPERPVVSPPCPIHADQLASRCGRCAAEAIPPPVDLLTALQRSVDAARTHRKDTQS